MHFATKTCLIAAAIVVPAAFSADFNWHGKIASGQAIEIKGVNGFVHADASSGPEVEVSAAKHARRSDPNSVDIQVVQHDSGVTICAVYPGNSGAPNQCRPGSGGHMNAHDNDVHVDFTVRVPPGVRFIGRTVNGDLQASSLKDDAEAYTVNGKVRVSTDGNAQAKTVNGSIEAKIGSTNWSKRLEFHTVNGGITVELPSNASTEVRAETVNGSISTDFPLTVQGHIVGKHLNGTIGSGGRELSLKTVNGSIQLRRT